MEKVRSLNKQSAEASYYNTGLQNPSPAGKPKQGSGKSKTKAGGGKLIFSDIVAGGGSPVKPPIGFPKNVAGLPSPVMPMGF